MNPQTHWGDPTFPVGPEPGSFWAPDPSLVNKDGSPAWPGPVHGERLAKALVQHETEQKAHKAKHKALEESLVFSAKLRLERLDQDPEDAELLVAMVEMIVEEQREAYGFKRPHKAFHTLQGVRRSTGPSSTYTGNDSVTSGTSGPAKDPACVGVGTREIPNTSKRFANDGVSETYRKPTTVQIKGGTTATVEYRRPAKGKKYEAHLVGKTETWTAEVPICAQRFDDAGAYAEKHQNRLAQLNDIGKQAPGLRPFGLEKP